MHWPPRLLKPRWRSALLDAAIAFYAATFPDSEVRNVARTGNDGPISSAEFVVGGQLLL